MYLDFFPFCVRLPSKELDLVGLECVFDWLSKVTLSFAFFSLIISFKIAFHFVLFFSFAEYYKPIRADPLLFVSQSGISAHIFPRLARVTCFCCEFWLVDFDINVLFDWFRFHDSHQKTTPLENVTHLLYFLGSYCSQKLVRFKGVHRVWNSGHITDCIVENLCKIYTSPPRVIHLDLCSTIIPIPLGSSWNVRIKLNNT